LEVSSRVVVWSLGRPVERHDGSTRDTGGGISHSAGHRRGPRATVPPHVRDE